MVWWDIESRPTKAGRLGILDTQMMNMTLLTKLVARHSSPREDLVNQFLKENYGRGRAGSGTQP